MSTETWREGEWEYGTTTGPRKAWSDGFDSPPDHRPGWELDPDRGRPGESWERFEYHEERYWRRRLTPEEMLPPPPHVSPAVGPAVSQPEPKTGIPAVQEAVTAAATLLSMLKNDQALCERNRRNCELVQAMLERAEEVLYGRPQG